MMSILKLSQSTTLDNDVADDDVVHGHKHDFVWDMSSYNINEMYGNNAEYWMVSWQESQKTTLNCQFKKL